MKKLKVVTIVGTRPEIIRLSMLIPKLDVYTDHVFVHTGQNSDPKLNEVFFQDLGLRQPDVYLNVDTSSMGAVMGDTLKKSEEVFLREKPDAVMILGDTNSAIAAVVAERMHIPVYHMEAGNRSFDNNVPEELNRKMVDHVASYNLPYNSYSYGNLVKEGLHPRFLLKTGSPIPEIFKFYQRKIEQSRVLDDLSVTSQGYFLASLHRQENVDDPSRLSIAIGQLESISAAWGIPVLISTHPRTQVRLKSLKRPLSSALIFHEPFGYLDYNKLQLEAKCVISDSGTIAEESAIMGFPAVTLRDSMERPEALEQASLCIAGLESGNSLVDAIGYAISKDSPTVLPEGYDVNNFSDRVMNFVLSTAKLTSVWKNLHR